MIIKKITYLSFIFILLLSSICFAKAAAIRVNGEDISLEEFNFFMPRYIESYKQFYKDKYDKSKEKEAKDRLVEDLTKRELLKQEGVRRHLTFDVDVSEREVVEMIMKDPVFMTNGVFDQRKYDMLLLDPRVDWSKVRRDVREAIRTQKMEQMLPAKMTELLLSSVNVTDADVRAEYLNRFEKIKVKYIEIDPSNFKSEVSAEASELTSFYEKNKEKYKKGEQRK
ncbi:MAG: SurA N-terminal domain-containing protein, partial [bacterium]